MLQQCNKCTQRQLEHANSLNTLSACTPLEYIFVFFHTEMQTAAYRQLKLLKRGLQMGQLLKLKMLDRTLLHLGKFMFIKNLCSNLEQASSGLQYFPQITLCSVVALLGRPQHGRSVMSIFPSLKCFTHLMILLATMQTSPLFPFTKNLITAR